MYAVFLSFPSFLLFAHTPAIQDNEKGFYISVVEFLFTLLQHAKLIFVRTQTQIHSNLFSFALHCIKVQAIIFLETKVIYYCVHKSYFYCINISLKFYIRPQSSTIYKLASQPYIRCLLHIFVVV